VIVIPMAGRSQRFLSAGYLSPKFMLDLHGESVFAHAVRSFQEYFWSETFLFIHADDLEVAAFVRQECGRLGVRNLLTCGVGATAGQADTVALGLDRWQVAPDEPLTIFNIDTFRPGFTFPGGRFKDADGWLEVFRGSGPNWSYVEPARGPEPRVLRTAEKQEISELCCTGLYHFARNRDFRAALAAERLAPQAKELYVAPLYNHLIGQGAHIAWRQVERRQVVFCGTPAEYEALERAPRR
jgi:bifunctional N-acetylglucosamine-1-phosphate-uridyltransferase/glucosamine-1-phosphate-acetyltransferase GlmU-like protein